MISEGYSFTLDPGNRVTSDGTFDYTHDDEGNIVAQVNATTDETWLYTYNQLNQLVEAEHDPDGVGTGTGIDLRVEYAYDVFGNRIERSVDDDGDGAGSAVVEPFAYNVGINSPLAPYGRGAGGEGGLANAWADLDGSSSLTTRRLFTDAVDAVFARIDDADNLDWYLTDRLGSVRDIMDSAGTIQDHIDYFGFGVVDSESDPAYGDRYKWTARELDDQTGLQYNRARWYSFDINAWMSEDPIRFAAGDANLRRYVGNDAANSVDPSGLTGNGTSNGPVIVNSTTGPEIINGNPFAEVPLPPPQFASSGQQSQLPPQNGPQVIVVNPSDSQVVVVTPSNGNSTNGAPFFPPLTSNPPPLPWPHGPANSSLNAPNPLDFVLDPFPQFPHIAAPPAGIPPMIQQVQAQPHPLGSFLGNIFGRPGQIVGQTLGQVGQMAVAPTQGQPTMGYIDANASFIGSIGVQIGDGPPGPISFLPGVHPYYGIVYGTPGASLNWAPGQTVSPGCAVAASYYLPGVFAGVQVGIGGGSGNGAFPVYPGPTVFGELGIGTPGGGIGFYMVR